MTLARALQVAAGNSQESADVAEAIDFDGTNDFLSRASDLVGNTDSKTFTFSGWIYKTNTSVAAVLYRSGGGTVRFNININSSNQLTIAGWNSSGTVIFDATVTSPLWLINTFNSVLVSVDLSNTSNRYIYVNDILATTTWGTYTNANIDFTTALHTVAAQDTSEASTRLRGRLSNVFLDYTYRDLSIEANRRLFVTADLKPAAGQAALNPILYLPMSDPTQPGLNAGTGGNFTLTGTVARSGRGPNQYNAPYSDFDGTADYLSRTSIAGLSDSKTFTFSCTFISDENNHFVVCFGNSTTARRFVVYSNGQIAAENASGALVLNVQSGSPTLIPGRNYNLVVSVDLSDVNKRHYYVNGVSQGNWATYVNDLIDFVPTTPAYRIGNDTYGAQSDYFNGRLGALWFSTSYIDLSQPANLAKFVTGTGINAKPVDLGANGELPTGTSPLIYLPLYGNNAGRNYGTGGNFTVVSGPYTGARGPNEFWGNKADFALADGYLSRSSALVGVSNGKVFSFSGWFSFDAAKNTAYTIFEVRNATPDVRFTVQLTSSETLRIQGVNSAGTSVLIATNATVLTANTQYYLQVCIDLTDTGKRFVYLNGTALTMTWTTYSNDDIEFAAPNVFMGGTLAPTFSSPLDGKLSELYFTTSYIDFSQEANRLKFRDAFGNPVNLTQQIEDAAIPNPAVYMRFPPTAFGTNYGTGGNFTVNGTITDGGQL